MAQRKRVSLNWKIFYYAFKTDTFVGRAHNPEDPGSKPGVAIFFFYIYFFLLRRKTKIR